MKVPEVVDRDADARFRALVAATGQDPDDRWIGGYVENEWRHGRHIYETAPGTFCHTVTLEFGCNYGATAIVLAALGARVTGVDIDERTVKIATENVAR